MRRRWPVGLRWLLLPLFLWSELMLLAHLLLDVLALHTREHKTAREALLLLVAVAVASTASTWPLAACSWFHARVWLWLPRSVWRCAVRPGLWPVASWLGWLWSPRL